MHGKDGASDESLGFYIFRFLYIINPDRKNGEPVGFSGMNMGVDLWV
ncbi:MAG: hypothetical protein Q8P89_01155 [bacterium]|nr:hypothetical protein [bacterium]